MIKQVTEQYIGLFGKWGNIGYVLVSMCVRILNIMFILMYAFLSSYCLMAALQKIVPCKHMPCEQSLRREGAHHITPVGAEEWL